MAGMGMPWVEVAGISVPALVSVVSAVIAGRQAQRARRSEQEAERLRVAEARAAEHKYEVYEPVLKTFSQMFDGKSPDIEVWKKFWTWISIYGSADSINAYSCLMQCTFSERIPTLILMRLTAEFILAARRDLGESTVNVSAIDVMAPRITDLYDKQAFYVAMTAPLGEVYSRSGWRAPWQRQISEMEDDTELFTKWQHEPTSDDINNDQVPQLPDRKTRQQRQNSHRTVRHQ